MEFSTSFAIMLHAHLGQSIWVLTATVALVDESCVSRAVASSFEGRGYYYDYLWQLDWYMMLWLIIVHRIESWVLICIRHVCQGYGLGACIYTPLFFMSFFIQNHSLISFLDTFPFPEWLFPPSSLFFWKYWLVGEKCRGGRALLVHLGCMVPDCCQNLSSKGGELEQNIPKVVEVVGGIARRGGSRQRDHYMEWCVGST